MLRQDCFNGERRVELGYCSSSRQYNIMKSTYVVRYEEDSVNMINLL